MNDFEFVVKRRIRAFWNKTQNPESGRFALLLIKWLAVEIRVLKKKGFAITAGVDSDEVSAFVSWVKSLEQTGEKQYTKPLQILVSHDRIVSPEVYLFLSG
jgi:hypothetical protein